jgi:osmotically-inducible protein OsmY
MTAVKIFTILALLALSACSGNAQRTAQSLASSAPGQVKDAALAVAIKGKLATIDLDSSAAVNVDVNNGSVTLSGQVRSQKARRQFEAAARSIGGVRNVDDRTTVNPKVRSVRESLSDATLIARIDGTLLAQTGVNALKVKTGVHSGLVTLTGTVSSRDVKQTMLDSVRALNGVKSVVDHIQVHP